MTRCLLDTSVLIGDHELDDVEAAISVVSLAELHFGVLVASDPEQRGSRVWKLGIVEASFDPLPLDSAVAREWGRLAAAVRERGGSPRRRAGDLAIAATANVHDVELLTADTADLAIIDDLVRIRHP